MVDEDWRYDKKIAKIFRPVYPEPPEKVLVICDARTGSNYLMTLLGSHPYILNYWEPYGHNVLEHKKGAKQKILQLGLVPYLEHLMRRRGDEAIVGFKTQYWQLEESYGEEYGLSDIALVRDYLKHSKDIKVIHLKRANKLAVIASLMIAIDTKRFFIQSLRDREPDRKIEISVDSCERRFNQIDRYEKLFDEFFAEHRKLDVSYEKLVAKPDQVSRQILEFLGVPDYRLFSALVKQNIHPLKDVIINYTELKAYFADSPWAIYFTD